MTKFTWLWPKSTGRVRSRSPAAVPDHQQADCQRDSRTKNFLDILVDPSKPNVDIVAVHGLNPLNKQCHAEATWTARDKLWLRDFLPARVPSARIFLFGYNSNVAFQTASSGVREQAENLLDRLEKFRIEEPHRPLIFVCHSLGGIVVKRALVHAKCDRTYETIWGSTFGIAFFGTPHRGGNHAELGDIASSIARSITGSPENTFMKALKARSWFLEHISDDFRQLLEDFQILSFYETRPVYPIGLVVDQRSATLGLPGTREKQIALDADHRSICKFENDTDPGYVQVADNIGMMADNATASPHLGYPSHITPRSGHDGGNVSYICGNGNETSQTGTANHCWTNGDANETHQFGVNNRGATHGKGNITTQRSSGA